MMRVRLQSLRPWIPLFLVSLLSLFLELAVIRWLSAEVRLLAYYKNLVLLAAFLGLAIGFAQVGKAQDLRQNFPKLWLFFVVLVILIAIVTKKRSLAFPGSQDEMLWQMASLSYWLAWLHFMAIIVSFFLITTFLFIPVGQMVAEEMAQHLPVKAYVVNIIASLCGIWLFSLLSYLRTPPVLWFGAGLLGFAGYFYYLRRLNWWSVGIFIFTLAGIAIFDLGTLWSPYNRLNLSEFTYKRSSDGKDVTLAYLLDVQHAFFQTATDLSQGSIDNILKQGGQANGQFLVELAQAYELPFQLVPAGSTILVVGSGMGNDVAAATRLDMGTIIAVEIDPVILDLGRQYHPEHPYDNPRVKTVETDARSFFTNNQRKFDLVVFGLLDSHTLLSSMSSVRLDSYVYTLDSFHQVHEMINKTGFVVVSFSTYEWIEERLGRMLSEEFGANRIFINRNVSGTTFVAGDVTPRQQELLHLAAWQINPAYDDLSLATDNWPYLYLRTQKIPSGYWQVLLVIALVLLFMIARSYPDVLRPDWSFWFLGAAFLLIEFKSITELALLFGSTWFVNSLAISGVLVMALLANLYVLRRSRVALGWVYSLLFASLILGYVIPLEIFAGLPVFWKGLLSILLLSLPLLFAGIIFSESLRRVGSTSHPLASNFSGSAVGGLLEYGSVLWGTKSLYGIGILLYLGAFIASYRSKK